MNLGEWWFRSGGAGWRPGLYEWFFEKTRMGITLRTREETTVYDFLGTVMEPKHSVLEFGPGTGNYTVHVARRCTGMVTIEVSEAMQEHLRERLLEEGVANVSTRLGRLEDGAGTAGKFDGVLAMGPLFYVRDLEEGLLALTAALEPGGWTIFTVPLPTPEGRWHALNELVARRRVYLRSPEETVRLAKRAGLEVERTNTVGASRKGLTFVVLART